MDDTIEERTRKALVAISQGCSVADNSYLLRNLSDGKLRIYNCNNTNASALENDPVLNKLRSLKVELEDLPKTPIRGEIYAITCAYEADILKRKMDQQTYGMILSSSPLELNSDFGLRAQKRLEERAAALNALTLKKGSRTFTR